MARTPVTNPLGEFEQMTLLALLRLEPDAYGASIRREIEERAGRAVLLGAVYTTLDRMERKGLVSSWVGDPTPERGGRRKKFYRLEPAGAEALARRSASSGSSRPASSGVWRRALEARGDSRVPDGHVPVIVGVAFAAARRTVAAADRGVTATIASSCWATSKRNGATGRSSHRGAVSEAARLWLWRQTDRVDLDARPRNPPYAHTFHHHGS